MITHINRALMRLSKRAEHNTREELVDTFVDVGPLFVLLTSVDHQIIYGRRGTGKTHALEYLAATQEDDDDLVLLIDLRQIGSSSGLYSDTKADRAERATRLLVDTLSEVHDWFLTYFVDGHGQDQLHLAGPCLDRFSETITEVRVAGVTESEESKSQTSNSTDGWRVGGEIGTAGAKFTADNDRTQVEAEAVSHTVRRKGTERYVVNFGAVQTCIRKLMELVDDEKRCWVLLDEWSSVPTDLQPFLADLLKRSLLPVGRITVKIAAIEHRTNFQLSRPGGDYIGIELGADIGADINLDDFMVFDNDEDKSRQFFAELLYRHVAAAKNFGEWEDAPEDANDLIRKAFTQRNTFDEFVRAAEGVPRDAIYILSQAAQKSLDDPITMPIVREAALNWYQRDKEAAVSANEEAKNLLHWIIDEVIGERKARAFLLRNNVTVPLIERLFDERVIHVLKRNISTHDKPGVRFDVYKLDYGCYVDRILTSYAPQGLLQIESDDGVFEHVDVPPDDYRSIRRAILEIDEFSRSQQLM